jgi:hypothetical protein
MLSDNSFINNTFVDCQCGVFIGGGRHHTVKGNRFYHVVTPFHLDDRGLGWFQQKTNYCKPPNGTFFQELDALDYTHPPYSTKYPELLPLAHNAHSCYPENNVIEDNRWCGAGTKSFSDVTDSQIKEWGSMAANNVQIPAADCHYGPPTPPPAPTPPAPSGFMCDFEVVWTRSDHTLTTNLKVRAHANASFEFKGCTVQGSAGQGCVNMYKIAKGVNTLVNLEDGKGGVSVAGVGTCCNTKDMVVGATRSNCSP